MNAVSVLESYLLYLFTFLLMLDTCSCQLYSRYHTHIMSVDFQEGNLHFSVLLRSLWCTKGVKSTDTGAPIKYNGAPIKNCRLTNKKCR